MDIVIYYHTFNQYKYMHGPRNEGWIITVGLMDEEMWKGNHLQSSESLIGNDVTMACAARCNSDQSTLLDKWNEGGSTEVFSRQEEHAPRR